MFERFTQDARGVVERAVLTASARGEERVGPPELLVALLEAPDCRAVTVLEGLGVTRAQLLARLRPGRDDLPAALDDADVAALSAIGVDVDEILRRCGPLDTAPVSGGRRRRRPRFSRAARTVLELALREAVAARHHALGTEHLLLGLAREGDAAVLDALCVHDLTLVTLREAVVDAARRAG